MKKILKALSITFFLLSIVVIIPAIIPDEEYTVGAKQWLDEANSSAEIDDDLNRYNAVVGFYAEAEKDMVVEGARLIAAANALFDKNGRYDAGSPQASSYWNNLPLKIDDKSSDQIYEFNQDPLVWLANNQSSYHDLMAKNQVLLGRFRKLMTMDQYSRSLKLDYSMPYISYSGLMDIKKLNNLSIVYDFINADKKVALNRLQKSIGFSRLMMAQSVELIEKMIASKFLEDDLMTYSLLLDYPPSNEELNFVIANLNDQERTLLNAYKSEFASMSSMLVMGDFDDYKSDDSQKNIIQYFIMKSYIKPKKIENKSHEDVWLYNLSKEDMALASRNQDDNLEDKNNATWWDIYMDPLGYVLMAIAMPAHNTYIDRIDHLDATISLLNLKSDIYSKKIADVDVNQYVSGIAVNINAGYAGSEVFWDKENKELTYAVPNYTSDDIPRLKIYTNTMQQQ